jgi:putative transposase
MSRAERAAMIDRAQPRLSLTRQCGLLAISRSSIYYRPVAVDTESLALMRCIDEQYLRTPFYGSRRMTAWLRTQGYAVSRERVRRLMRRMGLQALYQRPRTSHPAEDGNTYPYLLRDMAIERPHQVWAADITYIPMARGFLYLVAIMDWASRAVLAWRLSNTMDAAFCVEALEEALARYGPPGIVNTDRGAQFTATAWIGTVTTAGAKVSMDGKGRFIDNIFLERLWRSLKYEEVYLYAYDSVAQAKTGIGRWIRFYNEERLHQALGYRPPAALLGDTYRPVDMPLRLDNADALPTYPQAPQQPLIEVLN